MLVWSLVLGHWAFTAEAASPRPNFIIILADDMGYADLSCYGNDRFETPHIDALAKAGMRFTDFHSNGAVCSPTRAALMTGRYQQRSGVDEVVYADPARGKREDHGLRQGEVTLAELLKGAGYRTAIAGKWHLGYAKQFNPIRQGFEAFHGYVSGNVDFHSHIDQAGFADWWQGLELKDEPGYTTHLITRHALQFIDANKDEPFCLYVAHEAPHSPYQGPGDPPVRGPGASKPVKGDDIPRAYREMVQEMDKGVGEIVAKVKALGLAERTLVFFFSDNGGTANGNNGPLRGTKGTVWEGGHRVPAIAWWEGKIKPGTVTHETAIGMDLMPTMLELANVKPPGRPKLDGVSLASVLLEQKPLASRTLFWEHGNRQAVRQGPWKLVANPPGASARGKGRKAADGEGEVALFNLAEDLGEKTDLAAKQADRVKSLQNLLDAWKVDVEKDRPKED